MLDVSARSRRLSNRREPTVAVQLAHNVPGVPAHLDDARDDVLACMHLREAYRTQITSTNPPNRLNAMEIAAPAAGPQRTFPATLLLRPETGGNT